MDPDYHTEMDDSPLFGHTDKSMYRSLIGRVQWAITRVWIDYGSSILSWYNMVPREGHLIAMKKLFGYLKEHMKGRIVFDTRKTDVTHTTFANPTIWKKVYGNVEEDMPPPDMPIVKMKPINIKISFHATFGCKYFQKDQILRSLDSGECQNRNQNDRHSHWTFIETKIETHNYLLSTIRVI